MKNFKEKVKKYSGLNEGKKENLESILKLLSNGEITVSQAKIRIENNNSFKTKPPSSSSTINCQY